MKHWRTITVSALLLLLAATACSAQSPTPDTEAFVQTAVAATITASAGRRVTPTFTLPATATSQPGTTPAVIDETPSATPSVEPKLIIAESDVDGNDGNEFLRGSSDSNSGRVILLPGFAQSEIADPPVFRDRIVFQIEVHDTRAGAVDGVGIERVVFRLVANEGDGDVVYEHTLYEPPFCVFGGEPHCLEWSFADHNSQWPSTLPIVDGLYMARIDIVSKGGSSTQWRWRFFVNTVDQPEANTARITGIAVQNDRFVVDFETLSFEPSLPGQHLHFFFDTVLPADAGIPGRGPWKLHPSEPGGSGASPFTGYGLSERPDGATQMCVLVANPDHSVVLWSGNCVDLP